MSEMQVNRVTPNQYRGFARLDLNHDGRLTMADTAGKNQAYRRDFLQFMVRADQNQDFAVTLPEYAVAFRTADTDGDGHTSDKETAAYLWRK